MVRRGRRACKVGREDGEKEKAASKAGLAHEPKTDTLRDTKQKIKVLCSSWDWIG
jgi:hypothetical protein